MADPRPLDRHWYADQLRYSDRLRFEGQPPHLQAAMATVQQALDLGRQVQLRLDRPWHESWRECSFARFPHQAWPLLWPKHRRDLRAYLALTLPSLEHLRDQLADDLAALGTVPSPPAPEVGPIGPRSRPSPFAARAESCLELL